MNPTVFGFSVLSWVNSIQFQHLGNHFGEVFPQANRDEFKVWFRIQYKLAQGNSMGAMPKGTGFWAHLILRQTPQGHSAGQDERLLSFAA